MPLAFAFPLAHAFPSPTPPPPANGPLSLPNRKRVTRRPAKSVTPAWSLPTWLPGSSPIYFTRVRVLENRSLSRDYVRQVFDPLVNVKVTQEAVNNAVSALCEWYRLNGFLFSAIDVDTWPSSKSPLLVLRCVESSLEAVKVLPVSREGIPLKDAPPCATRPSVVARAMGMKIGQPFKWHSNAFRGLMQLGVFTKAWVEVEVTGEDRVALKVLVVEEPRGRFEPGFGMNQSGQMHGDISLLDRNFLGRAQTLRIEWQKKLDMTRAAGGIEFIDERIGAEIPISFTARAFRRSDSARQLPSEDRPRGEPNGNEVRLGPIRSMFSQEHDSDRDGIAANATYRFAGDHATFSVGPIFERIHWREWVDGFIQSRNIDQLAWKNTLAHNTLSPPMAPHEGHRFNVEHTMGHTGSKAFHKCIVGLSQYMPLTRYASFSLSTVFGLGTSDIPPHEMTVLGGMSTVRGYMYGELGRAASWRTTRLEVLLPFAREEVAVRQGKPPVLGASEDGKRGDVVEPGSPPVGPSLEEKSPIVASFMEKLPNLSAYAFADSATRGAFDSSISGSSVGLGVRVAGMVNVELARAAHGREPRLSVSLVDHRIHY